MYNFLKIIWLSTACLQKRSNELMNDAHCEDIREVAYTSKTAAIANSAIV